MKRSQFVMLLSLCAAVISTGCGGDGGGAAAPAASTESAPAEAPAEALAAGGGVEPSGTAVIAGTITYEGDVPSLKAISMSADPDCEGKHTEPVPSEVLVLGDAQTLGNVFVRVTAGLPEQQWAVPSEPVVIDQRGCLYVPHVVGVMANQELEFLNSDGILHNVHALPEDNREFNMAMPAERKEARETFSKPEDMFRVKCDVHPWMNAWVAVMDHPFFDATADDGAFSISGLAAGTYEIEAWHERLGTQTASVTVADGETGTVDLTFSR